jgi:hypothetical protein
MRPGKALLIRTYLFLLFLLAAVPAYCQRGTIGVDVGQVSDKFGALAPITAPDLGLNAQFTVIPAKDGSPNVVVGGEVRVSSDNAKHATEFAVFGGPLFPWGNFSAGFNVEIRKILLPSATVDNVVLNRFNMELLELPIVLKYKFGPGKRAFVQAQGEPEFTPRFRVSVASLNPVAHPNFDYGYTVRGSLGYIFGKWYAKGSYETRYFKFIANPNNPSNLYNWRSNLITGGVGLVF